MFFELVVISFLFTLFVIPVFRPIAVKLNLIDYPTDRKKHDAPVPFIGGLCIFMGLLVTQFFLWEFNKEIVTILFSSLLILILGIWDDIVNLKPKFKLLVQFFIVTLTIYITDIKVETLGVLFGFTYSLDLGFFSLPFTIIAIIGLTNAFNMIDGVDGLASTLSIIAIFGILFASFNSEGLLFNNILLAILSGLIPFLFFNISRYKLKVFLGDGGSLFLGFVISLGLIYNSQNINNFSPSFAIWCVAVPVYDFLTVLILRKISRHPLLNANRDHLHHSLENFGISTKAIMLIITSGSLGLLIIGYILEKNFSELSFSVFIFLFLLFLFFRVLTRSKDNASTYQ